MGSMQILALGIFCIGITHSLPNIGQDDLMDVESDILNAIGHRDGMDYDDADNLMSLLEEANDDLDLEGEEGSAVDEVDEPRMMEPVDPVPTTFAPVGVNRVKPSYNSQDPDNVSDNAGDEGDDDHLPVLHPRHLHVHLRQRHRTLRRFLCQRFQASVQDKGFWRHNSGARWHH